MMGLLGKIILFIFCIDMLLYLFAPAIGNENMLLFQDDLFRKTITINETGTFSGDMINTAVSKTDLQKVDSSGSSVFWLYDTLLNGWTIFTSFFKTVINIFATPVMLINVMISDDIGIPREIALIIFAPLALLLVLGLISIFRGWNI